MCLDVAPPAAAATEYIWANLLVGFDVVMAALRPHTLSSDSVEDHPPLTANQIYEA